MYFRLGVVSLVVGLGLLVWAGMEWKLSRASSAKPEEITLKQLLARGPDGNPNVILKDFRLADNFVYEEEGRNSKDWKKVWIPAVPAGEAPKGDEPFKPAKVRAVVFSFGVKNEDDFKAFRQRPQFEALVTNRIMSLGTQEKQLLEKTYPGTDFSTCLIIQEGRKLHNTGLLALQTGGGGLLLLSSAGLFVFAFLRWREESARARRKKRRPVARVEEEEERPRVRRRRPVDD